MGLEKSLGPKGLLMQTASFLSFSYFFPLGGLDFRRREEKQSFLDSGEARRPFFDRCFLESLSEQT